MERFNSVEALVNNQDFRDWVLNTHAFDSSGIDKIADQFGVSADSIENARLLVMSLQEPATEFREDDENVLWERIQASIDERNENQKHIVPIESYEELTKSRGGINKKLWYGIAASLVILVSFYFGRYQLQKTPEMAEMQVSIIEKKVPKGQKLKLHLPDGSKVSLNSSSSIIYPERFDDQARIVEIVGEAYFEVKKDSLHPFIVKSKNTEVEVLGTTFNIHAYPEEKSMVVSLLEGKVKVSLSQAIQDQHVPESIFLEPGEEASLSNSSNKLSKRKIRNFNELSWMDGVLAFNNESVEKVFNKLELWYGVDFVFNTGMPAGEILTGKFQNEYLENVLLSINYTIRFDFKIEGDTVYINF